MKSYDSRTRLLQKLTHSGGLCFSKTLRRTRVVTSLIQKYLHVNCVPPVLIFSV